jgi:hypothetical protein
MGKSTAANDGAPDLVAWQATIQGLSDESGQVFIDCHNKISLLRRSVQSDLP